MKTKTSLLLKVHKLRNSRVPDTFDFEFCFHLVSCLHVCVYVIGVTDISK